MATMMQRRTNRSASPERWRAALRRALAAGLQARQLAGSGQWVVGSASRPGVAYETDGVTCACEAAMLGADPVCLHRAAYWHAVGLLDLDPEPPTPAAPAAAACRACFGEGYVKMSTGGGLADWVTLPCRRCREQEAAPLAA